MMNIRNEKLKRINVPLWLASVASFRHGCFSFPADGRSFHPSFSSIVFDDQTWFFD
jgi:hypothetical protein